MLEVLTTKLMPIIIFFNRVRFKSLKNFKERGS